MNLIFRTRICEQEPICEHENMPMPRKNFGTEKNTTIYSKENITKSIPKSTPASKRNTQFSKNPKRNSSKKTKKTTQESKQWDQEHSITQNPMCEAQYAKSYEDMSNYEENPIQEA
jgi:hypothetical protein